MAVEYEISSDVAVIKETGSVSQCARVTQMYSGQITYDDEAGSKFATPTTESVAGQTLQVQDGDNVLEITQASLSGLELEAKYSKNS